MSLEDNPILMLAAKVYAKRMSFEESVAEASSYKFLEQVDTERCREILTASIEILDQFFDLSRILSGLNLACAEAKGITRNDEILWARMNELQAEITIAARPPVEALEYLRVARNVYREKGCALDMAGCELGMGNIYRQIAEHRRALESFQSARKIFQENGMTDDAAGCYMSMANVYLEMAEYECAIELYQLSKEIFEESLNMVGIAKCATNMAYLYLDIDEHEPALELFRSASKIFEGRGESNYMAACLMGMGTLYTDLGQYDNALELYEPARNIFEKEGMTDMLAKCEMNMGMVYCLLNQHDIALELYKSAGAIFRDLGIMGEMASCHMNMGLIYNERYEYEKALELYRSAREIFIEKEIMDGVAMADMNLGLSYCSQFRYAQAAEAFEAALSNQGIRPGTRSLSLYGLGKVSLSRGEIEKARNLYREAIDGLESVRDRMSNDGFKSSFLESNVHVYMEMIDFCLRQGDFKSAIEYIERLKSRNLAEMLARRDVMPRNAAEKDVREYRNICAKMRLTISWLEKERDDGKIEKLREQRGALDKRHTELVSKLRMADPSFDPDQSAKIHYEEIREMAGGNSAILEMFPMENKTAVFILSEYAEATMVLDGFGRAEISGYAKRLEEASRAWELADDSEKEAGKKQWKDCLDEILKSLYERLFRKILNSHIRKEVNKLVLIPYAELHLLPLHAAFHEEDGKRRYMLDEYRISYAPSAKVLKLCRGRQREKQGQVIVASADPPRHGRLSLFHSRHEANAIQNLFPGARLIKKATVADLIENGYAAQTLHFTGHASPDALLLHASEDKDQEAELRVEDVFLSLDLPKAYLVSLGGCKTGVVPMQRGLDEYIGLPSAFLHAGAATLISSLWSVNDLATSLLMKKTYRLIKDGSGKGEALNQAQLWLKDPNNKGEHLEMIPGWLRSSEIEEFIADDLSHPSYWAGFICSGMG